MMVKIAVQVLGSNLNFGIDLHRSSNLRLDFIKYFMVQYGINKFLRKIQLLKESLNLILYTFFDFMILFLTIFVY